jgi:hypothetical protein
MSYVDAVPPLPDWALERMSRRRLSRREKDRITKMIKVRKRLLQQARLREERRLLHAIVPEEPALPE